MAEPGGTRYDEGMTGLPEEALRRVESVSPKEQDAIASSHRFSGNRSVLRSLAREAMEEHRRGETRP
jgi:hypothetical protein